MTNAPEHLLIGRRRALALLGSSADALLIGACSTDSGSDSADHDANGDATSSSPTSTPTSSSTSTTAAAQVAALGDRR